MGFHSTDRSAPVILFVYKRLSHTIQTISSLRKNAAADGSDLIVFSDGPKDEQSVNAVQEVRNYIRNTSGFKSVRLIERDVNWGLAKSVISGMNEVFSEHANAIVIEDDIVTAPIFLRFMNDALNTYEGTPEIMSITGFNFPIPIPPSYPHDVYLSYRSSSWGWGTWRDRWNRVDWSVNDFAEFMGDPVAQGMLNRGGADLTPMLKMQMEGKIDSWAIRWCYSHFKNNAYCLFPRTSLVQNIGFDGSGTHCGISQKNEIAADNFASTFNYRFPAILLPDRILLENFRTFQDHQPEEAPRWSGLPRKVLRQFVSSLKRAVS